MVSSHLISCVKAGETAGPFVSAPYALMHVSGLGTVPKKNGKLRLIHDLSAPQGTSVNDGIQKEDFSLNYSTVDTAVTSIMALGAGCYLSKIDIRNAFRLCPVRPEDWHLLGIKWEGCYYFEKVLPFGLRSSPYIFNTLADSIEYILRSVAHLKYVQHYLDDFLIVSPPYLSLAQHQSSLALDIFHYLGVPVAEEKVECPATNLVFLGMELDTVELALRLPADKLRETLTLVTHALHTRTLTVRNLASVLGKLSFAARAMVAGRTFLRLLYDFQRATQRLPRYQALKIPASACEDLEWWKHSLEQYEGKSLFLLEKWCPAPDIALQTDASGNIGYGAYFNPFRANDEITRA